MIGVIVWSSAAKQKAVIWCEDQGALAYLHGRDNVIGQSGWPEAGDMVRLESEMRGELRHAFNVRVIDERKCAGLPGILRDQSTSTNLPEMAATAAAEVEVTAPLEGEIPRGRPSLRVVSSQETPVSTRENYRAGQPQLVAVKSVG